jgi:hypothetical protein
MPDTTPRNTSRASTSQKEVHYLDDPDDPQIADSSKRLNVFQLEYTALNIIGIFLITVGLLNLVVAVSILTTFYVSLSVIFTGI